MAEFKLGRIRFVWKDSWVTGTTYYVDDVVKYGGQIYICTVGHTANADFYADLEAGTPRWNLMTSGTDWKGAWAVSTLYKVNDVVKYGGNLYICNDSHTSAATESSGLETDLAKWDIYAEGFDWKGAWTTSTRYKINDLVKYGGLNYVCTVGHTSAATASLGLEDNSGNWEIFNAGVDYKGTWANSTRYKVNDVVKNGGGLWICVVQHTSTSDFSTDIGNWNQFVEGIEYESTWSGSTQYQPGDVVSYGGNQYIAKTVHTNVAPTTPSTGATNWDLYSKGFDFQNDWTFTTTYKIGNVVRQDGYTYLATADVTPIVTTATASTSSSPYSFTCTSTTGFVVGMAVRFSGTTFGNVFTNATYYIKTIESSVAFTVSTTSGGSTFQPTTATGSMTVTVTAEPTNTSYWATLNTGIYWKGTWADDTDYLLGDAVRYGSNTYICVLGHRSEGDDGSTVGATGGGAANSRPDQDTAGTYWNSLTIGSPTSVLTTTGDLVYYSGAGPTRLPIGTQGQVLTVGANDTLEWQYLWGTDHVYYVAPHGVDSPYPIAGGTLQSPWASIRYACEQIEKGPKNPNAQYLLELNRAFIQREVSAWIRYQIDYYTNTVPTVGSIWYNFDYDEYKCERDVGYLVDRLIWDLGHGGNLKIRAAALAYVNALGQDGEYSVEGEDVAYSRLSAEADADIATFEYMKTLVENVLNNEEPATVYQNVTDDSVAIVEQFIDADYVVETGVVTKTDELIDIVITALTDQDASNIPERSVPNNTVHVKTGRYREVLPIIVPAETCILGDEVRSTNAGPEGSVVSPDDVKYSIGALGRLETVLGQIILGSNVTESSGNTATQDVAFPYASAVEETDVKQLVRMMQHRIDWGTGVMSLASSADPTGYNTSFLAGFKDARTLLKENKEFIKDEITSWLTVNYPTLKYSKTSCRRDVGYIVDAITYDLTYGGSYQTLVAGLAYFDGNASSTLMIDSTEVAATSAAYSRLKTVMQQIIANTTVTKSTGNSATQWTDSTNLTNGSNASVTVGSLVDIIINIIAGDSTRSVTPQINVTQIASGTTFTSTGHTLAVGDAIVPRISANGLVQGRKYWVAAIATNTFTLAASYGGSALTSFTNGTGLDIDLETIDYPTATNGVTSTTALITAAQTLDAAQETIVQNVIDDLNATAWHTDFVVDDTSLTSTDFRVYVGKHTLAHTYVSGGTVTKSNGTTLAITNFVYNESTGYAVVTTATHGLSAGDIVDITNITVSCLSSGGGTYTAIFPSGYKTDGVTPKIRYIQNKCIRDVRLITEAVMFDFMFNSNFQTIKSAYSYLRSSATDVFSGGQKAITRAALENARTEALSNVGGNTTAQARITTLMTTLDDIIFGASDDGSVCQTEARAADYARLQIERNRSYVVAEISAWIASTYTTTVTNTTATTDLITVSSTSWLQRNAAIRFTGTTFGGISTGTTYYVQNVVSSTQFKIATTRNSNTALTLSTASGSCTVSLYYNSELCLRDVNTYLDAIKFDLMYPGNYRSRLAARYYINAVKGSLEEDMYYVRNGTGVRNQTLEGLTGDLLPENEYGTSRVSAGAYVSLDPGWGPNDFRTWIISRSPYVQNVATFGTAAIGQKIDGALHAGGNDSIVSNDFTQLISDGIGAWVTNNGRAELVSVFTYYSHIGYLAENGGRIRGTNGNNSYGDFGSVAEGYDVTEVEGAGLVDNRNFKATVGSVFTDSAQNIYNFEFANAGSEYTEATWTITGAGSGVVAEQDEFRDGAVFEVRLLDNVDDSTSAPEADGNFGGSGYITNSNTAQGGSSTQITIAATDGEISSAYVGMKIYIDGGTGAGQYGIIATYNSGTKVATVNKESTGTAGWDHVVPGTTIVSPDASSTYTIEPAVSFTAPTYSVTGYATGLPTSGTWTSVIYGNTANVYTALSGTYSGAGTGATWQVIRNGSKYSVSNSAAGTGYTRLETITIDGASLGGTSTTHDVVITITSVNSSTGAIQAFDFTGYGVGGLYVALRSGATAGATSVNGTSWTARSSLMPSSASWISTATGLLDDGSSVGKTSVFVAVAGGSANTTGAYSNDGITWTAANMQTSATWQDVTFGEGRFVAIASDSTVVRISQDGVNWDLTGTLPSTGFTAITYGMGLFVAVKSGTDVAVYSTDGVSWTSATLPSSSNWNDVVWGNGRFVAISNTSGTVAAYSLNGSTWTASTLPASASWTKIAYGQGVFHAVSSGTAGATSEDGIVWTSRTMPAAGGYADVAFGNPARSPMWVGVGTSTGQVAFSATFGAKARARAFVAQEKIFAIRLVEPGSGYSSAPTITITDPNNIYEAPTTVRIGVGALATPSFKNRGTGYASASADVDTGDGYGDYYQSGQYIAIKRMTKVPVAGSNVVFDHLPDQTFKLVNVLTLLGSYEGSYTAFFQISPDMKVFSAPDNNTEITTRIRYSQVRLTGHDFLDIGTGGFDDTNYPNGTPVNAPSQANETVENNGGRVFYTSTDQDGNFRVGDLFTIEQSTGVATLNADAFNIAGLQELTLGEVSLGGGSASITEFSTDPFFTANSDSIVPTQRAIKAYITSQIGGGGAALNVNSVTAGSIYIAGTQITTTGTSAININATLNFTGGVTGLPLAFNYFIL